MFIFEVHAAASSKHTNTAHEINFDFEAHALPAINNETLTIQKRAK